MRDGERKVITTGNMFYNTLSARQAHVEAIAAHTDVPVGCRDYFNDVDIPTLSVERIYYLYLQLICTASTCTIVVKHAVIR
jgi:hypothetical protein